MKTQTKGRLLSPSHNKKKPLTSFRTTKGVKKIYLHTLGTLKDNPYKSLGILTIGMGMLSSILVWHKIKK